MPRVGQMGISITLIPRRSMFLLFGHTADVPNFQTVVRQHWHVEHMGANTTWDINLYVWVQRVHTMIVQV